MTFGIQGNNTVHCFSGSVNLHAVSPDIRRLAGHVPLGIVGGIVVDSSNAQPIRLGGVKALLTVLARLDGDIFVSPLLTEDGDHDTDSETNVVKLFR